MNKTLKMVIMKRKLHCLAVTCLLLNFKPKPEQLAWASPTMLNKSQTNLDLFKYEESSNEHQQEMTTTLPYYMKHLDSSISNKKNITNHNSTYYKSNEAQQSRTDLYTIELTSQHHHPRQAKHDDIVFNYKCPKQHFIHPCDCLELDKRAEMFEGSGEAMSDDITVNGTPTFEMIEEEPVHPDLIETVVLCKNIRNVQVLTEAIRGFQGHRVNYFVLDGCKLPPFPNNLFKGIHIIWMEVLNSTMQFHDNFFQNMRHCP